MSISYGNSNARNVPKYIKDALPNVCHICGKERKLEYHHVIPYSEGGMMNLDNIIQLCHSCHMDIHRQLREQKRKESEERYKAFLERIMQKEA